MKLISKTIVLSSIVGVTFYGFLQLRQPSAGSQQDTNTLVKGEQTHPLKKKMGEMIVIAKQQNRSLTKLEPLDFKAELDNDFEQDGRETAELNDTGNSEVSFENGLLIINAENAVLADVLVQIASEANIPFNSESVNSEHRITISIQDTPIDTALRELLTGYDYFFLYSADKARLQAAWVYPAGTGQTIALTDHENRSRELAEDDLYSSDPVSRVLALQQYASSDTKESVQRIKDAMRDENPDVRTMAILSAQENAIELSVTTLKELAESDPSPIVRSVALNTLSMNSELSPMQIGEFAEIALDDADKSIREQAEAILEGLKELENKDTEAPESQHSDDEVGV